MLGPRTWPDASAGAGGARALVSCPGPSCPPRVDSVPGLPGAVCLGGRSIRNRREASARASAGHLLSGPVGLRILSPPRATPCRRVHWVWGRPRVLSLRTGTVRPRGGCSVSGRGRSRSPQPPPEPAPAVQPAGHALGAVRAGWSWGGRASAFERPILCCAARGQGQVGAERLPKVAPGRLGGGALT